MATALDMSTEEYSAYIHRNSRRRIRVHGIAEPSLQTAINIVGEINKDTIPDGFTPAHGKLTFDKVKFNENISSLTAKAIQPISGGYIPEKGGNVFIPGSGKPIPPVMSQTAIRYGAEAVALCIASKRDPKPIREAFNKMWGLPDEFDVGEYAPVCNPDRTKPWLRYGKDQNYEVSYLPAAQAMLDVTTGSYTNTVAHRQREIDWDRVRAMIRTVMTLVFFCEPGQLAKVYKKNGSFTLNFIVNTNEFETMYTPKFDWNPNKLETMYQLSKRETEMLLLDKPRNEKFRMAMTPIGAVANALPPSVLEEMRENHEFVIRSTRGSLMTQLVSKDELAGPQYGTVRPIEITTPSIYHRRMHVDECFKYAFRAWMLKEYRNQPLIHQFFILMQDDDKKEAGVIFQRMIPPYVIHLAFQIFAASTKGGDAHAAYKDMLHFAFGIVAAYPNFQANNIMSLVFSAIQTGAYRILDVVADAYRSCLTRTPRLTVFDFLHSYDYDVFSKDPVEKMRERAFLVLSRFYSQRYFEKQKFLADKYRALPRPKRDKNARFNIIKYQMRTKLYPHAGYLHQPENLNEAFRSVALRYIAKRPRFRKYIAAIESLEVTIETRQYVEMIDHMLDVNFREVYFDIKWKSDETKKDVEAYFCDEHTWNKHLFENEDKRDKRRERKFGKKAVRPPRVRPKDLMARMDLGEAYFEGEPVMDVIDLANEKHRGDKFSVAAEAFIQHIPPYEKPTVLKNRFNVLAEYGEVEELDSDNDDESGGDIQNNMNVNVNRIPDGKMEIPHTMAVRVDEQVVQPAEVPHVPQTTSLDLNALLSVFSEKDDDAPDYSKILVSDFMAMKFGLWDRRVIIAAVKELDPDLSWYGAAKLSDLEGMEENLKELLPLKLQQMREKLDATDAEGGKDEEELGIHD